MDESHWMFLSSGSQEMGSVVRPPGVADTAWPKSLDALPQNPLDGPRFLGLGLDLVLF
jgi:hypothetical protein